MTDFPKIEPGRSYTTADLIKLLLDGQDLVLESRDKMQRAALMSLQLCDVISRLTSVAKEVREPLQAALRKIVEELC